MPCWSSPVALVFLADACVRGVPVPFGIPPGQCAVHPLWQLRLSLGYVRWLSKVRDRRAVGAGIGGLPTAVKWCPCRPHPRRLCLCLIPTGRRGGRTR